MKATKLIAIAIALTLTAASACIQALAADNSAQVYVTIASGTLMTAYEPVNVTDIDGDGALTVNDALYAVHEASYSGGAAAGYATAKGDYGLYITKLWGVENGGSYGYYLNNSMVMGMTDPVKDGDSLVAYAYTDAVGFSDAYSYFDKITADATAGGTIALTLYSVSFDANFNPVSNPCSGATITIDGKATDFVTAADGTVNVTLPETGTHTVSATSTTAIIVPPVCVVTVAEAAASQAETPAAETPAETAAPVTTAQDDSVTTAPSTGDLAVESVVIFAAVSLAAITILRRKGHDA
jgi:hypothetical protein